MLCPNRTPSERPQPLQGLRDVPAEMAAARGRVDSRVAQSVLDMLAATS